MRYVSVYSRSDGIVDWRACLDPAADQHIEVRASHCGMALSEDVYRLLAGTLPAFARRPPVPPLAEAWTTPKRTHCGEVWPGERQTRPREISLCAKPA